MQQVEPLERSLNLDAADLLRESFPGQIPSGQLNHTLHFEP